MIAMIHADKCLELGLPEPKTFETQVSYVLRCMEAGHKLHTRIARYIGIGNLHSIIPALYRMGIEFEKYLGLARCPFTGETPPFPVDWIFMTAEQSKQYRKRKPAKS